jgi:hypothetical protein
VTSEHFQRQKKVMLQNGMVVITKLLRETEKFEVRPRSSEDSSMRDLKLKNLIKDIKAEMNSDSPRIG